MVQILTDLAVGPGVSFAWKHGEEDHTAVHGAPTCGFQSCMFRIAGDAELHDCAQLYNKAQKPFVQYSV